MMESFVDFDIGSFHLKIRTSEGEAAPEIVLALHGLTGNEESMGIFTTRVPPKFMVLMPRGIYESPLGGYSWVRKENHSLPGFKDFRPAASRLLDLLQEVRIKFSFQPAGVHLLGFSQGAALAYSLAGRDAWSPRSIAALSGFLPDGFPANHPNLLQEGLKVFIAHGTEDDLVPISEARYAVRTLTQSGAKVTFCEADVGHKLSAGCFQALSRFYQGLP